MNKAGVPRIGYTCFGCAEQMRLCHICRLRADYPADFVRLNAKVGAAAPLSHYSPGDVYDFPGSLTS